MPACARCGFSLTDDARKCAFCGHAVGAEVTPAPPPSRIPQATVRYSAPPDTGPPPETGPPPDTGPSSHAGAAPERTPTTDDHPMPPGARRRSSSMATSLVIAALVGAIAGGAAFMVFIALRG